MILNGIEVYDFRLEQSAVAPGANVWFLFSFRNITPSPIKIAALGCISNDGAFQRSWTNYTLGPGQAHDWRDHFSGGNVILYPGLHYLHIAIQFPGGAVERMSDDLLQAVGTNDLPGGASPTIVNPDFELPDLAGWSRFTLAGSPEFNRESMDEGASALAVHTGRSSLRIMGKYECFEAGVSQKVLAAPGSAVELKAAGKTWCRNDTAWGQPSDPNVNIELSIGIDTGEDMVWSKVSNPMDTWGKGTIIETAGPQGFVTIYLKSNLGFPHTYPGGHWPVASMASFWDSVTLKITPPPVEPPVEPPVTPPATVDLSAVMAKLDAILAAIAALSPVTPPAPPPVVPPPVTTTPALVGINVRTGGRMLATDFDMIRACRIEAVKLMPGGGSEVDEIPVLLSIPSVQLLMARVYIEANRLLSSGQYAIDATGIIAPFYERGVKLFEITNEPNLKNEGWTYNWQDGATFAEYWVRVVTALRARFPQALFGFPGLSPDVPPMPSIRLNDEAFILTAAPAVAKADWIGVHAYFQNDAEVGLAIARCNSYAARYAPKPVYVTEFSNANGPMESKAAQYLTFYRGLRGVKAAISFILSSASGNFQSECWDHIPNIVQTIGGR